MPEHEALRLIASLGVRPNRRPGQEMSFPAGVIDEYAAEMSRQAAARRMADAAADRARPRRMAEDLTASDSSIFDPLNAAEITGDPERMDADARKRLSAEAPERP